VILSEAWPRLRYPTICMFFECRATNAAAVLDRRRARIRRAQRDAHSLVLIQIFLGDVVFRHFAGANFLALSIIGFFHA